VNVIAGHFPRQRIVISCSIAICRIGSRTRSATCPVSTFFRYFGIHTRCTFKSCFVCAPSWYRFTRSHYTTLFFACKARVSTIPEGDTKYNIAQLGG
jgi:hypothetical protein